MDLGDGVLRSALGAKAVAARLEVRLEDRLEHQLERGLHDPVGDGRDPQPADLPAPLGDQSLPHGPRREPASLQLLPQAAQQRLDAPAGLDGAGGLAVHSRRPGAPVRPDPAPGNQQDRRVMDKVVQVIEPTLGIVGRPSVQLGLDPQYPRLGLVEARPRRAGIHRRPPGLPVPALPTRCRPSPCDRLSRSRTTTAAPSPPSAIGRRRACPPPTWPAGGEGDPGRVPAFTMHRLAGAVPSCSPAASPRVRRRPSPWPPDRRTLRRPRSRASTGDGVRCWPAHIRQVGAGAFA